MENLGIAIVGGMIGSLIGGLFSIFLYVLNVKKERFFNLQERGNKLLNHLYEYQDLLGTTDIQKDSLKYENEGDKEEERKLTEMQNRKQRLRENIWALINIYFPTLKKSFQEYTNIEVSKGVEETGEREEKIRCIANDLMEIINKERAIGFIKI